MVPELIELQKIVNSPPSDKDYEYTRIKKDIFHAFHMLPIPINHGARPAFLRALRVIIFCDGTRLLRKQLMKFATNTLT